MAADIRPARNDDIDALERIEHAAFDADRMSRGSFRRLIAGRSASVLVAQSGGAVDGYCAVLFRTGSRKARLYSIAARPGGGTPGLGRALLAACEAEAARKGSDLLRLEVRRDNARAIAFYERNGFRPIGLKHGYYADGQDALLYEKTLDPAEADAAATMEQGRR